MSPLELPSSSSPLSCINPQPFGTTHAFGLAFGRQRHGRAGPKAFGPIHAFGAASGRQRHARAGLPPRTPIFRRPRRPSHLASTPLRRPETLSRLSPVPARLEPALPSPPSAVP